MHALDTTPHRSARHSLARGELPGFRPRYLGLSEAEFFARSCGHHTRRLNTDWLRLHGPDQELEFDFSQWHCGFAVAAGVDGTQRAGLRCRGRGFYATRLEETILLHNETCTLRLLPQAAHAAWIVRKPTHQGERLGLELHDEQEELLAGIDAAAQAGGLRTAWATLLEAIREETTIKE